jgi:subtilisin family serine protease
MADDTRVTHSRSGLACAIALLCAIGCALPTLAHATDVPTGDDRYQQQWWVDNGGFSQLFPAAIEDSDIDAPEAWEIMEGQGVTVAVVDQMVYAGHPDIAANVEPGQDFTKADSCTTGDPVGPADHGTMVAGVIAAARDNGGIIGVAPLAHVMPLRAIDNCGNGKLQWILDAFSYAGAHDIPIVSASFASDPLAGPNADTNQDFVDLFDRYPNTLFVVAAGNEGNDNDDPAHPVYPCSTRRTGSVPEIPNLICVGMTDNADKPGCMGNTGQSSVDLFAPGLAILSTVRGGFGGYAYGNGTSLAAPMVAGTAALVLSAEPQLGAAQVAQRLVDSVDRKDPLVQFSASGGRLNAAHAVGLNVRGSNGGESVAWASCDRDHDGLGDSADNCKAVANADQADADGDGVGDACDGSPRGSDDDGDARPLLDDRCPLQAAFTADGCPVVTNPPDNPKKNPGPTATPTPTQTPAGDTVIVSLKAKVTPKSCPKSTPKCTQVAKVTVKLSRQAKVALKLEQQVRKRGKLVWKRVSVRSMSANAKGTTLTVRGKRGQPRSKYRVTATLANKAKAVSFRV